MNAKLRFVATLLGVLVVVGLIVAAMLTLQRSGERASPIPADRDAATRSRAPVPSSTAADGATSAMLTWNVWPEDGLGRSFNPVPFLRPATEYLVTVDLAGFPYRVGGVTSTTLSESLQRDVASWRERGALTARLTVLMLTDPAAFARSTAPVQRLEIDLARMAAPSEPPSDPFAAMKATGAHTLPAFVFGRVTFRVRTATRVGDAALAFSVWANDRPVDQFTSRFCVAPDQATAAVRCDGRSYVAYTLRGVQAVRLGTEAGSRPDGALHFVDVGGRILGVLWRKSTPDEFITWPLDADVTPQWLEQYLGNTVMPAFYTAGDEAKLRSVGRAFYNVLFPDDPSVPETGTARAAFEAFVSAGPRRDGRPRGVRETPSIFVRLVLPTLRTDLMVPLGLMNVRNEFVGYSVRVESPLPLQAYDPATTCVTRWVVVVPPATEPGPLQDARAIVEPRVTGWQSTATVYEAIEPVRQWLAAPDTEASPLALLVTSHHGQDAVWFDETDRLLSREVRHRFGAQSIALLNGCGTGGPGATDFLAELNRRGFGAVIATSTQVTGDLAGTFLACFARTVEENATGTLTLAEAYFAALRCTRDTSRNGVRYGARALAYMFLGNGHLRLCPPKRTG